MLFPVFTYTCHFGAREVAKFFLCFGEINLVSKYELIGEAMEDLDGRSLMKGREETVKRTLGFNI